MRFHTRQLAYVASALALVALLAYLRNLIGGVTFVGRDHLTLVSPARHFLAETLAAGRIPQWWDGVGMGTAFAANPMHGSFYPLAWISALAPGTLGTDLVIVLHVFLLGLGAAHLSRRLGAGALGATLAGVVAMTCGYTASMAVNGVPLMTLAWVPWVGWATVILIDRKSRRERIRAALVLAAFFFLTVLSGDPAGAISAGLVALAVAVARADQRRIALAYIAAAAVGGVLLAAIVVVPAYYLLGESGRSGGLELADAGVWSMHPLRIIEWIWPQVLGDATESTRDLARAFASSSTDPFLAPAWSISLFIGAPVLALAYLSGFRSLVWASLVFVVLALGTYTPLYGWYRAIFLPEQVIRYPERHLAGAIVIWSALAGVGFSKLMATPPSKKALKLWGLAAGLFLAVALSAWLLGDFVAARLSASALAVGVDAAAGWSDAAGGGLTAAFATAFFVGALWMRGVARYKRPACALASLALLWPLVRESVHSQPVLDRDVLEEVPAILAPIASQPDTQVGWPRLYRHRSINPDVGQVSSSLGFASLHHTARPNTATAFGFAYVPGYDPSLSERLKTTWELSSQFGSRILQLYDIEYAFLPEPVARAGGMEVVHHSVDPRLVLARQHQRRPRAFVAQRWQRVTSEEEVRARLFGPAFDLGSVTLIGAAFEGGGPTASEPVIPCQMESKVPERVTMHCSSPHGGYAVLLDAWAPGWSATVDGEPSPIERADSVVRATAITSGSHVVVFEYRTPGLVVGCAVSIFAWIVFLVGMFLTCKKQSEVSPVSNS